MIFIIMNYEFNDMNYFNIPTAFAVFFYWLLKGLFWRDYYLKEDTRLDLPEVNLKYMFKCYGFDSTKVVFSLHSNTNNLYRQ